MCVFREAGLDWGSCEEEEEENRSKGERGDLPDFGDGAAMVLEFQELEWAEMVDEELPAVLD